MKSFGLMVLITFKYWQVPLKCHTHFPCSITMVQKPNVEVRLFLNIHKDSLSDDVVSGIGGLNITPHLVNPQMNLFFIFELCVTSMVNLKLNLGV
jgi:hypothetical protein